VAGTGVASGVGVNEGSEVGTWLGISRTAGSGAEGISWGRNNKEERGTGVGVGVKDGEGGTVFAGVGFFFTSLALGLGFGFGVGVGVTGFTSCSVDPVGEALGAGVPVGLEAPFCGAGVGVGVGV
jgi:hypothetical protein